MKRNKIFCFGELLLRMSPQLNKQWIHNAFFSAKNEDGVDVVAI